MCLERLSQGSLAALLALASLLGASRAADSHPLAPSLLEVREQAGGRVEVVWKTPTQRVRGSAEEPRLPPDCARRSAVETREEGQSVISRWTIDCGAQGLVGRQFGVDGLGFAQTDALLRIALADGRTVQRVLRADDAYFTVPDPQSAPNVVPEYFRRGIEYMLTGLDRLLFVFGLILLATGTRLLIETLVAFTVGHSITLSLGTFGIASIPSRPLEVLIALSLFVLAAELGRGENASPTLLRRFPGFLGFLFGLLHGLGFAAALRDAGLPPTDLPLAVFSFNLGIEAGQLTFILAIALAGLSLRRALERLPWWSARVPVYGIGCLSVYWVLERVAELWR